MAENGITGPAVCVVYDGTGYGLDGTMWGGEIFYGDCLNYVRAGHLVPMLLPGGEAGIRHPWRMAMGALFPKIGERVTALFPEVSGHEKAAVLEMLRQNVACVKTSGMGRLFDAMSALLGVGKKRSYEGQPAIMLEAAADAAPGSAYDPQVKKEGSAGMVLIDGAGIIHEALRDFESGTQVSIVAGRFHETIAQSTAMAAGVVAEQRNTDIVCLSGGCFQNALLLGRTMAHLWKAGLRPVVHRLMPPNDESISYGQVVIAGMRRSAGRLK
jgi:hydrogenase maturation protein HypF